MSNGYYLDSTHLSGGVQRMAESAALLEQAVETSYLAGDVVDVGKRTLIHLYTTVDGGAVR